MNPDAGEDGDRGVFCVGVGDRCDLLEKNTSLILLSLIIPAKLTWARSGGGVTTRAALTETEVLDPNEESGSSGD